jgi:hypothetical protein
VASPTRGRVPLTLATWAVKSDCPSLPLPPQPKKSLGILNPKGQVPSPQKLSEKNPWRQSARRGKRSTKADESASAVSGTWRGHDLHPERFQPAPRCRLSPASLGQCGSGARRGEEGLQTPPAANARLPARRLAVTRTSGTASVVTSLTPEGRQRMRSRSKTWADPSLALLLQHLLRMQQGAQLGSAGAACLPGRFCSLGSKNSSEFETRLQT